MRNIIACLALCPYLLSAQVYDDFNDGSLSGHPHWAGDVERFQVNNQQQLQSIGPPGADTVALYCEATLDMADTLVWQWYWRLDFNPSNNNKSRVYLQSDSVDLIHGSGYYVQLGENGSTDVLRLYRQVDGDGTLVCSGSTSFGLSPTLKVRVSRFPSGAWRLEADTTLTDQWALEAEGLDSGWFDPIYFGLWCKFTTSNVAGFYFDDISVDSSVADTLPPHVDHFLVTDSHHLQLSMSETLHVSALQGLHYQSDHAPSVSPLATFGTDSTVVDLYFSAPFPIDSAFSLHISGVEDVAGNPLDTILFPVRFIPLSSPFPGDIQFSEIMADPTPSQGLPEVEYIELFNPTNKYFDLFGLELSDPVGTAVVDTHVVLRPLSYLVMGRTADASSMGTSPSFLGVDGFPNLNNDGDMLSMKQAGTLLDSLHYKRSWYVDPANAGGGISLERVHPFIPCSGAFNWRGSTAGPGGTPGFQNAVYNDLPDKEAPRVVSHAIVDSLTIRVDFDEAVLLPEAAHLTLVPARGVDAVTFDESEQSVLFHLSAALERGMPHQAELTNLSDCSGNIALAHAFDIGLGVRPAPYDLLITELNPVPSEGSDFPYEFVEVYNASPEVLDMSEVQIADHHTAASLPPTALFPGAYAVLAASGDLPSEPLPFRCFRLSALPSLNNASDRIRLLQGEVELDAVAYDGSWHGESGQAEGLSLERKRLHDVCATRSNWASSTAPSGGTPGLRNSVHSDSTSSFRIVSTSRLDLFTLQVQFNQRADTSNTVHVWTTDLDSMTVHFDGEERGIVRFAHPLPKGHVTTLNGSLLENCALSDSVWLNLNHYTPDSLDVVINELLFDPHPGGEDFVEVFNRSGRALTLEGWSLARVNDKDSLEVTKIRDIGSPLYPEDYLVWTEDPSSIARHYPYTVTDRLHKQALPTMPNDKGNLYLLDEVGAVVDVLQYDDGMHFSLMTDVEGVSLERISPDAPSNDRSSWHSAGSGDQFATPGYANSQHADNTPSASPVWLPRRRISPDNDGFEDVLEVSFSLPGPGWLMSVDIVSMAGRVVARPLSNKLCGVSGSFYWNGLAGSGQKVSVGPYVALVQLVHLDGHRSTHRLPFVVATFLQ